ncbi:MAG: hypothetical protein H7Y17_14025 [Chlorobia bacterium]|nr:hypothetical protein [Fimbriimonadaceae bacterium]
MVWRASYRTLIAKDLALPDLRAADHRAIPDFTILVGGMSFHAYREMAIWKRLILSESLWDQCVQAIILESPTAEDLRLADAMVPRSERARTLVCNDPDLQWWGLLQLERPEQSFAAVVASNQARIMIKGVPTEDAWDAFLAELKREN